MPGLPPQGRHQLIQLRSTMIILPPAQRQVEVRGTLTHAQLTVLSNDLHYAPYKALERYRQLIAVTYIAEHA